MIIDVEKRVERNSDLVLVRKIVCGVVCDYRDIEGAPEGTSVIASLDGLMSDFPPGTRVRVTIERER